ncbi:hypothetical protein HDU78_007060 [Chytriomyces hyalinus]|nr:hypothetical protein HDU78_007060 [Chytriomyces hyalinus]KAJ3267245.1 hypothetical protein HDU77_003325 [Chytriomyces hyalinus]
MFFEALQKLAQGSQFVLSIMLSTQNSTRVGGLPDFYKDQAFLLSSPEPPLVVAEDEQTFGLKLHSAAVKDEDAPQLATYPSPFNKDVRFPEDMYALILWAFAWALLHHVCAKYIFKPLSFRIITEPRLDNTCKDAKELEKHDAEVRKANKDRIKFQTSTWRAFLYGISTAFGLYICLNESWSCNTKLYFEGYPHKTTFWLKLYYNIGFGNYAYQLVAVFYEPRQSDFVQMVSHHVATVTVMLMSYVLGFTRAGVMILFLHDCSDPLMEIAKSLLYAKRQVWADAFFGLFAMTFLVTRDIVFPIYIIAPLMTYSKYEDGVQMPRGFGHYFYGIAGCLYVLQALNIFWGYLIVKMIARVVRSGSGPKGDVRDEE